MNCLALAQNGPWHKFRMGNASINGPGTRTGKPGTLAAEPGSVRDDIAGEIRRRQQQQQLWQWQPKIK